MFWAALDLAIFAFIVSALFVCFWAVAFVAIAFIFAFVDHLLLKAKWKKENKN